MRKIRTDKYDSNKLLLELKSLCEKLNRKPTYKEIDNSNLASAKCYERHFGSVSNAIKIIKPDLYTNNNRYSNKYIFKEFNKVYKELNKVPTIDEFNKNSNQIKSWVIKKRFGSWNKFLKINNLIPNQETYTKEKLIKILKDFKKENNRNPIEEDFKFAKNGLPTFLSYFIHFGTWNNALKECGFKTRKNKYIANDGHECLSVMELYVDNWMYEHNIKHEKEVSYPYHKKYNKNLKKRCDWLINDNNTYVELFGLMIWEDYKNKAHDKIEMCNRMGLNLIEIYPDDLKNIENCFSGDKFPCLYENINVETRGIK